MSDDFTRGMFAWLNQVHSDHALPPTAFKLAYAVGQHINRRHGKAWPSQTTLASLTDLNVRTVRRVVEQLESAGHLEVEVHRGGHRTNVYRLAFKPDTSARSDDDTNQAPEPGQEEKKEDTSARSDDPSNRTSDDIQPDISRHPTGHQRPKNHLKNLSPLKGGREEGDAPARATAPDGAARAFEDFWRQYPKPDGDDDTSPRRAFQKAVDSGADPAAIIAGAMRYAAEVEGREPHFIASPVNWLHGARWNDKPQASRRQREERRGGKPSLVNIALDHGEAY